MTWSFILGVALFILAYKFKALSDKVATLESELKRLNSAIFAREAPLASTADAATTSETTPETIPVALNRANGAADQTPELVGDWSQADLERAHSLAERAYMASSAQRNAQTAPIETKTENMHFVFSTEKFEAAISFIKTNWFYLVAATSLAFAGIFFIQYGIEKGLLPPPLRVFFALLFGASLIGAGEWLRRKGGDEADDLNAYLPSVFASAGIITLFAAILGARQLYNLISLEVAFGGLIAIAGLAVFVGWHYGALLTLIGLVGAVAAPFVVGGESETVHLLYFYFAMIVAIGLSVDALKRSAFVSATALAIPTIGAVMIYLSDTQTAPFFIAYGVLALLMALFLPFIPNKPIHESAMPLRKLHQLGPEGWPDFPERLAAGAAAIFLAIIVITGQDMALAFWAGIIALFLVFTIATYVLRQSPALDDLVMVLYLAMPVLIIMHGAVGGQAAEIYTNAAKMHLNPSASDVSVLIGLGIAGSLMAAWRSIRNTHFPLLWAMAAASFAPVIALAIGVFWNPIYLRTETEWAFHLAAIAAALTYAAFCFQKWFKPEDPRSEFFAFAALSMLGYGVSVVLTETALTLTLAGMTLLTALLDRRFNMKLLTYGVQLGVAIVSFRLIANPGVFWAFKAPLWELFLAFFGVMAFLAAAWVLMRSRARMGAMITIESAIATFCGVLLSILLVRYIEYSNIDNIIHAPVAVFAMIWLMNAAAQLYRLKPQALQNMPEIIRWVRIALASFFAIIGLCVLLAVLTIGNPLVWGKVAGLPIFNSLIIAYLLPALLLGAVAYYFDHLSQKLRIFIAGLAVICLVMFIGLEIRHLWQGDRLNSGKVLDGELYSYTIAMLLTGAGFLITALYRGSDTLRKAGLIIIGLTVAKVFFVDMSGLTGLTRIFSFLILGLVLAGLAWLNRWMVMRDQAKLN